MRPLIMSQPKIGIHCSSRLTMNTGLSNSGSSAKVSQADWCLGATMIGPLGSFSRPRISQSMPATTRSSTRLLRPHAVATAKMAR
jgi:hypothetical protein